MSKIVVIGSAVGSGVLYLLGGYDGLLEVFGAMMALDYLSGIARAAYKRELSSSVGFQGFIKKFMLVIIVMTAAMLDSLQGDSFLRDGVLLAFIINEAISITENAKDIVSLPDILTQVFDRFKNKKGGI